MTELAGYIETNSIYAGNRTIVYRAIRASDERQVVIKVLRNPHPNFNELVQFRNQYVITRHLAHRAIVRPLVLERYGNGYALVMPDGGDIGLWDYWKKSDQNLTEFITIAIQLAEALHYLIQQRIVHKDIKPSNILIHPETREVKLIDFSISSLLPKEQQQLVNPNVLEGTLAYISPEQTGRTNRGIDYRTDFYSLGVTFYELLTGKLPFFSNDPMELVHCHIAKMPTALGKRQEAKLGKRQEAKGKRGEAIPGVLSEIVLKLMAKNAEDRYQSALGLKYDLERCLEQLKATGEIASFEIGTRDKSDRFIIPEKLYGREKEVRTLLSAFDRVASGNTQMMLVAGFSGIGKTVVINEVHKPIVEKRGYFIKGKFDQFNRNIPFSAFVAAFQDLIGQLLGESEADLATWKNKIAEALGENARVIIDAIPALERIVGQQPPVPELSGSGAQNRFNLLFGKFVRVFTTIEHPLVIFLDDLQWADSASLNLLKLLMDEEQGSYLLVLGAYRDNEVFPTHPLMLTLTEIQKQGANIDTLTLAPLGEADITRYCADTLLCSTEIAAPLSQLVYQKTKGNPFFTTQFLVGLHEDNCITFDGEGLYWQCDLTKVRQLSLTDDVVEFMVGRLQKLPEATQNVLKLAACIGNQFDLATLAIVSEKTPEETTVYLWKTLQEGLILPQNEVYKFYQEVELDESSNAVNLSVPYKFLHDRVQQAAYCLISEDQKQVTHLRIGRLLLNNIPATEREEKIFEIVNQFDRGINSIDSQEERQQVAGLNLMAGVKAKSSTAYSAAVEYLRLGRDLLPDNSWEVDYSLTFSLYKEGAEAEYLSGNFDGALSLIEVGQQRAQSNLDFAEFSNLSIVRATVEGKYKEAIAAGKTALKLLGVTWEDEDLSGQLEAEVSRAKSLLGSRKISDLLLEKQMSSPESRMAAKLLMNIDPPAYIGEPSLYPIVVLKLVNLSLKYGNVAESAKGYSAYGVILGSVFGDYQDGYEFGKLANSIAAEFNSAAQICKTSFMFSAFLNHWMEPIKASEFLENEGYKAGLESGEFQFAGYLLFTKIQNPLCKGENLEGILQNIPIFYKFVESTKNQWSIDAIQGLKIVILNLMGMTDDSVSETQYLKACEANNSFHAICFYEIFKSQALYLYGDPRSALESAERSQKLVGYIPGFAALSVQNFYHSLSLLALHSEVSDSDGQKFWERVEKNQESMRNWSQNCPENFIHKYFLVEAEKARVSEGRLEAIELYDRAIAAAKENDFIQEEGLANELAAKFYLDWGKEKIAATYMQEAYYCYARWEAKAKTDRLEEKYPQLLAPILQQQDVGQGRLETLTQTLTSIAQTQTSGTGVSDTLDLASILQAAQTLSGTIQLEELLGDIVEIVLSNAGAGKAALLVPQADEWQLRAIAQIATDGTMESNARSQPLTAESPVPVRLVRYVKNTRESVLIDEGKTEIAGILEGYLLEYQPQSVLCTPLEDRGNLVAILYLEHLTSKGVFTRNRQTIIEFLCTQAAISLQNAQLYNQAQTALRDLQQAQLQLVQSEKMSALGNLVAGVAHEINNPVGFLQGNIEPARDYVKDLLALIDLYQKKMPDPDEEIEEEIEAMDLEFIREDLPDLLESMNLGVERIRNISRSLRTFSRKDREQKTEFDVRDGIDSTLLILKHRTKANQQRPEIEIVKDCEEIPVVQCFPGQLNQVFMNILANAIDAFDDANKSKTYFEIEANPNRITIRTAMVENWVKIIITDNGCGMKAETKDRIFEQGFTTKGVGKGTGLGMAIAYNIVTEKHGGTITCDSTLGVGTTFTIVLPMA